jgi:hypothetical protein
MEKCIKYLNDDLLSEDIDNDDISNIDPALLRMDGGDLLALDGQERSVESTLGVEETPEVTISTIPRKMGDIHLAAKSTRLHGISRHDQDCIDVYTGKTHSIIRRDNSGTDRTYADPTLCNRMLAVFDWDADEAELASGLGML